MPAALTTERYVRALPDFVKVDILRGYEQLRKTGVIGDEPIRLHAQSLMRMYGADLNVVLLMNDIALECFRYFTYKHQDDLK